jgi:hypothetical protein
MDTVPANADDDAPLRVGGRTVAHYVTCPQVHSTLSPRPYLHPVYTLDGVVVTDAEPDDHRCHLGVSLAVQDVSGTNLWGGRTYVRDAGYSWRGDHGRIAHLDFLSRAEDSFTERLRWCDPTGRTLLEEERRLGARLLPGRDDTWVLDVSYALTAPPDRDITLGSPATNGRPGGSGYGGFFWRASLGAEPPRVFTETATGERSVNGSTCDWVAMASTAPHPYTLIFTGLAEGDHWFVRTKMYPGVCAALAFEKPRTIAAGATLTGRHTVMIADAVLSPRAAGQLAVMAAGGG